MQSFLQYRRFRKDLEQQLQSHGADEVSGAHSHPLALQNTYASHERTRPTRHENEPDLERGNAQLQRFNLEKEYGVAGQDHVSPRTSASTEETKEQEQQQGRDEETERPSLSQASSLAAISTAETTSTTLGQTLTGVNVRSRTTKEGGHEMGNVFVVGYHGSDDQLDPHNWSNTRRWLITFAVAWIGFIVGFASSVDSAVINKARIEFGVSEVAESLATGLYLAGFGVGAFVSAPVSETIGRNPVYLGTMVLFMIFIMASALAPNLGAQLTFRFIAGLWGATPLTNAGGSLSDIWTAKERTATFPIFAQAAFLGPVCGPIVGGWIGQSSLIGWRWVEWITLIWTGVIFTFLVFLLPETYAPILLKWKASHLRSLTGDDRYVSELEVRQTTFWQRLLRNMYRPFQLIIYEPIVDLITLYLTIIYIVLFTFLTGFDFIFGETGVFGLSQGLTFTSFIGLIIGFSFMGMMVPFIVKRYNKKLAIAEKEGRHGLPPEQRLIFAMIGGPFIPIGLFWMGWTSYKSLNLWPALVSTIPIGFGIMCIFVSSYQYLIDAFEKHAASALVGATFVRYMVAGGMIEVSIPMYENLKVHWTLTVLACISLLMTPVPFVFYRYGAAIRKKSKYAASSD